MTPRAEPPPVVTIDGPAGAGKTTAGVWLARRLGVRYVESGFLFRGLAATSVDPDGPEALARIDIDVRVPPDEGWRPTLRLDGQVVADLRASPLERRLAEIAGRDDVRTAVAAWVAAVAAQGGCVIVGRRAATEYCPGARARILMTADAEVRSRRRAAADRHDVPAGRHSAQLRSRDAMVDERAPYTLRLDTTEMTVSHVREAVLGHFQECLDQ